MCLHCPTVGKYYILGGRTPGGRLHDFKLKFELRCIGLELVFNFGGEHRRRINCSTFLIRALGDEE